MYYGELKGNRPTFYKTRHILCTLCIECDGRGPGHHGRQ